MKSARRTKCKSYQMGRKFKGALPRENKSQIMLDPSGLFAYTNSVERKYSTEVR